VSRKGKKKLHPKKAEFVIGETRGKWKEGGSRGRGWTRVLRKFPVYRRKNKWTWGGGGGGWGGEKKSMQGAEKVPLTKKN